jgi:phosphatidylglycerol:prolipoprotein diacylglycerol transferase
MFPVLFRLGTIPVNSYGVALALSFLLGVKLGSARAARHGFRATDIADLGIWVMFAAIAGSRAFYVATHVSEFQGHWLDVVAIWKGLYGLSMLGGVLLAVVTAFVYIAIRRWDFWLLADDCIPAFALGILITRIGCFLNGCCFGSPTDCALGVVFPEGSLPASVFGTVPLHPTQLYSSLKGLFLLLVLLAADRRPHFRGFLFVLFIGLYGATRFGLEELRHFDHPTNRLLGYSAFAGRYGMTDNQIVSLAMVAAAPVLGLVLRIRGGSRRRGAAG